MEIDTPRLDKDWKKMEFCYIGKDGRYYTTYEALQSANAEFNRVMYARRTPLLLKDKKHLVTRIEDRKGLVTRV